MRVDVIDLFGLDLCVLQSIAHDAVGPFAILRRSGEMECISAHAVADDLGENIRAAFLRRFQFLENQNAGTFADHKAIAVAVPGPRSPGGLIVTLSPPGLLGPGTATEKPGAEKPGRAHRYAATVPAWPRN